MSNFNTLNIFIADSELKNEYLKYVEKHNSQIYTQFPNAGFDLLCPDGINITESHDSLQLKLNTNIVCNMVDTDWNFLSYYLYPRSSISKLNIRLANSVGIIDSGYRGNIIGIFDLLKKDVSLEKFSRVLQICSGDLKPFHVKLVDSLEELGITERGSGGFGSTGK
jgi:dUTP pyrophosphatase